MCTRLYVCVYQGSTGTTFMDLGMRYNAWHELCMA